MPVHQGFVAIKPPLGPGFNATWESPEDTIFIAVGLRPITEAWHMASPFDTLPRWLLYGGPMRNKHWLGVNSVVQQFYASRGFQVDTRRIPIAPPEFAKWPTHLFSWKWQFETLNPPLYRLAKYPATKYEFVKVA